MNYRLYRLIALIALLVTAIVPARAFHVYATIDSVSCNPAGFVVVTWTTPAGSYAYTLAALESSSTYVLPHPANGSTTTTNWTNGTFTIELRSTLGGGTAVEATSSITCLRPASSTAVTPEPVTETVTAPPPPETWEGAPGSTSGNFDGRINAGKADRYAVYCKAGELQVWDGVAGVKVGFASYAVIEALANPVSVAIGENVFLGRSNNELGVVIPGVFEKFGIALDLCISGGYDTQG